MDPVYVVDCVCSFMYNESPIRIFELVYDRSYDDNDAYIKEKVRQMQNDFFTWYGGLDKEHAERLVKSAIDRGR